MENNKIHHSFGYALEGLIHAFRDNRNIRIHTIIAVLVLVTSFILGITKIEKLILLLAIVLVLSCEMINTALEEMTDLITDEHRQEAKDAKDVAAGMVLITALGAIIVGIVIFAPYILRLIQ